MKCKILVVLGAACLALTACDQGEPTTANTEAPTPAPAAAPAAAAPALVDAGGEVAPPPYTHESGFAYLVATTVDPGGKKLHVFEDGKELGPGDSLHEDIRKKGMGLYSHWSSGPNAFKVYFSASDNSDPNTNGRKYEFRY